MWWKIITGLAMCAVIVASYVAPAPQQSIGEASRIFYYHVPQAWICVLAYAMSMVFSIRYLRSKSLEEDDKAALSAGLGMVFCILGVVTGAIFARVTWGAFWNWDPRQTSIFILLLIYAAYFALRNAVDDEAKRAALSAVYSIFAFITVPFLVFVAPRLMPSLHPSDSIISDDMTFQISGVVLLVFVSSLVLFTVLYFWIFDLSRRVRRIHRAQNEEIF